MQLTTQQLAAAIANFENRLKAKKLEVDSLSRLRDAAPGVISRILPYTNEPGPDDNEAVALKRAVNDFLTAKINWLLMNVAEFELNIKAMKSQQSGLVIASGTPGRG